MSVREARPADVAAIAEVQLTAWQRSYAGIVPLEAVALLDTATFEAGWRDILEQKPDPRVHVLVAIDDNMLAGFAAIAPSADDDAQGGDVQGGDVRGGDTAELGPLLVDPGYEHRGHGSRLLAAAVDLAIADGFAMATAWVFDADERGRGFLAATGWAPDGATRQLDMAGTPVREVRMRTRLTD